MLKFASDGIASFSYKPLRFPLYIGGVVSGISFIYIIFEVLKSIFTSISVSGLSLAIAAVFFLIGIIFTVLGTMGEYISRISDEAKGRPLYIIGEKEGFKNGN